MSCSPTLLLPQNNKIMILYLGWIWPSTVSSNFAHIPWATKTKDFSNSYRVSPVHPQHPLPQNFTMPPCPFLGWISKGFLFQKCHGIFAESDRAPTSSTGVFGSNMSLSRSWLVDKMSNSFRPNISAYIPQTQTPYTSNTCMYITNSLYSTQNGGKTAYW